MAPLLLSLILTVCGRTRGLKSKAYDEAALKAKSLVKTHRLSKAARREVRVPPRKGRERSQGHSQ